jgi:hypothetical protein
VSRGGLVGGVGEDGGRDVGWWVRGAAVDSDAFQVDLRVRRGRWGDIVVTEVGGDELRHNFGYH